METLNAAREDDRDTPEGRFRPNPDVDVLVGELEKVEIGGQVTYETLSNKVGRDIRESAYPLYAAIRRLLCKGMVFKAIPNIGYRRLTDDQCVQAGSQDIEACRRRAIRAARKARAGRVDILSPEERIRRAVVMTQAAFVIKSGSTKATRKLEDAITKGQGMQLTYSKTLEIFARKKLGS